MTKKRTHKSKNGLGMPIKMLLCLFCSVALAILVLLLCSLAVYQLPDPARYTHIASYVALFLSAVATGVLSARLVPDNAYLCALSVCGCIVAVMLTLAAAFGGVGGMAVSVYAAYTLISLVFAWLFSRRGVRRTSRR